MVLVVGSFFGFCFFFLEVLWVAYWIINNSNQMYPSNMGKGAVLCKACSLCLETGSTGLLDHYFVLICGKGFMFKAIQACPSMSQQPLGNLTGFFFFPTTLGHEGTLIACNPKGNFRPPAAYLTSPKHAKCSPTSCYSQDEVAHSSQHLAHTTKGPWT